MRNNSARSPIRGGLGKWRGYTWEIASWYVAVNATTGAVVAVVFSPRVGVSPGQTLTGTINSTNCLPNGWCDWTIRTASSSGAWTQFPASLGIPFTRADPGVLEAYDLDACNDLPDNPSTTFTNTFLYMPSANNPNGRFEVFTQSPWTAWQTNTFWPANGTPLCSWGVDPLPPRSVRLEY